MSFRIEEIARILSAEQGTRKHVSMNLMDLSGAGEFGADPIPEPGKSPETEQRLEQGRISGKLFPDGGPIRMEAARDLEEEPRGELHP